MSDFPPADDSWYTDQINAYENPTEALLYAVSAVTNQGPTEMDPLYDAVDTDALNELVAHISARDTDFVFAFDYEGCEIIIDDKAVHVHPP